MLQTTVLHVINTFQIIYDILEKIEIAITFSKLNSFHNSIIEPNYLLSEIVNINKLLTNKKLPFEPIIENILTFEKIMEIKSYSKGNQITFIIEIPIVQPQNYNYYHLYPLPTPFNENTFKIIIPNSKFLLTNEQYYAFFDTQCEEIIPEEYLCEDIHTKQIKENPPCEIQLLNYATNTQCQHVSTRINKVQIQKIENQQWMVIAPTQIAALQKCGKSRDNIPLNGTYIVEFNNSDCEVQIDNHLIKTFRTPKPNFKIIELPKIEISRDSYTSFKTFQPINLSSINLNELKSVYSALNLQHEHLKDINQVVHYDNISIYTLTLYTIIIIIAIYFIYSRFQRKSKKIQKLTTNEEIQLGPQVFQLSSNQA